MLEAVREAPDPSVIPAEHVSVEDFRVGRAATVRGIVDLVQSCARRRQVFSEAGASWALRAH